MTVMLRKDHAIFRDGAVFGLDMSSASMYTEYSVRSTTRVCDASTADQLDHPEDRGLSDTGTQYLHGLFDKCTPHDMEWGVTTKRFCTAM